VTEVDMGTNILEMKNITKKFPGVIALKNVSFVVKTGEILALVGENGAGKSTLMKILSGSYSCTSYDGSIFIDGQKVDFTNPRQSEDAGIAMIYQEISLHLDLSVAENMFLGNWRTKNNGIVDWKKITNEAKKYLDIIKLDVDPNEILRNLNTSELQLVSIAKALAKKPRLLVLDEPTSALTKNEAGNLFKIMNQLKQEGITSILISHKLDEVFQVADRITVMRDGEVVSTNTKKDTNPDKVVSDMVGRKIVSYYPKETIGLGNTVLKVENFTVPHPYNSKKNIVENLSFELKGSEILGIAGLVGSGRSELVNAIFGSIKRLEGNIWVDEKKVDIKSPADAIKYGIALITEDRKKNGLIEILNIEHNSTLATLKEISKSGVINSRVEQRNAKDYFNKLNIKAPGIDTIVQTLSGGNQQKVVLSKWLLTNPKILLMDEPTRGIDVGAKYEIYKIMTELVKKGMSIIMISSEMPELMAMSDRFIVLANGRIKGEFKAGETTHENIMRLATGAA
jgi:D-xylose transport system ATP-binding protein